MDDSATRFDDLTPREQQVARLMAKGFTNPQIADELGITFNTAKWHVSQVIAKTGSSSREEAVHAWQSRNTVASRVRRGFGLGLLHPLAKWTIASAAILTVALVAVLLVCST